MYIAEILWLLTWPLTIALTYWLSRFALRKFEENTDLEKEQQDSAE